MLPITWILEDPGDWTRQQRVMGRAGDAGRSKALAGMRADLALGFSRRGTHRGSSLPPVLQWRRSHRVAITPQPPQSHVREACCCPDVKGARRLNGSRGQTQPCSWVSGGTSGRGHVGGVRGADAKGIGYGCGSVVAL